MLATVYSLLSQWNVVPTLIYCILILFLYLKYKHQHESQTSSVAKMLGENSIKPMPSPSIMPIIGHIHLLRDYQHNPWAGFEEIRKQFGPVVSLKMGIHPMVLVSSSEAMREILLRKGDIFSDRPNFPRHHIIFGGDKENSLALCDWSNTHRDRRKLCKRGILPSRFSSRNQLLESIVSRLVVDFVDRIDHSSLSRANANFVGQCQKVKDELSESQATKTTPLQRLNKKNLLFLTSDIFLHFLCSESHSHSDPDYKEFVLGCDYVFWDINQLYLMDFLPFLTSLGLGFSHLKKLKQLTDFMRGYIDKKIFEPRHRKHLEEQVNKFRGTYFEPNDEDEKSEDYLDSIVLEYMANESSMSLADYMVGFADLLAGHAAVANILMRVLGHLALKRDIQDMICAEASKADIYNINHKPSLPVTEATIQEALRLASSPIVPHVARQDTSINGFYVPKGTMVLFNNYHLNLSDDLWTNPYEFDPLRFVESIQDEAGENFLKLSVPKHFMPFSVGLRQCLGYKMVETTTIVTVANLCRKYVVRANDEALVRRLLSPRGSVALNPDAECFEFDLYPR